MVSKKNNLITISLSALTIVNVLFLLLFGMVASAATNEFDLEHYNNYVDYKDLTQKNGIGNNLVDDAMGLGANGIVAVLDVGFDILTLIFTFGIIGFGAGFTMQNGQWTKWSTGAMTGTFLAIIGIRIVPIIALTVNEIGITLVINHIITMFATIGFFISVLMFLIGLFLRSLNKIFEHPRYFRWGRTLLFGSTIIMALSLFAPSVITNL